jgi:multidrug transporter EmrE-like cation transporter
MKILIYTFPVALLMAYSQIIVKWRTSVNLNIPNEVDQGFFQKLIGYLADPYIISGYITALLASFIWLFVVARLPLAVAFPVYIGMTFVFVVAGSVILLNEPLNVSKLLAISFILIGLFIGSRA